MGKKSQKYYAVKKGLNPGVYTTWKECQENVNGFSGAVYKSFSTEEEANNYLSDKTNDVVSDEIKRIYTQSEALAYVDGSFNPNSNEYAYGVIIFFDGGEEHFAEKFNNLEMAEMRNVAGEIEGAKRAMRFCIENGIKSVDIFYDYQGIEAWCTGAWRANKEGTKEYRKYYNSIKNDLLVNFVKIKAHSGNTYNELVDKLAKSALGLEPKPVLTRDNGVVANDIKQDDLLGIIELLEEDFKDLIHIEKEIPYGVQYELEIKNPTIQKIFINYYIANKKIWVSGRKEDLFNAFTLYTVELLEPDKIPKFLNTVHNLNVDKDIVESEFNRYFPNAKDKLPEVIKRYLHQAVYNLQIDGEVYVANYLVESAIRPLEGILKIALQENGFPIKKEDKDYDTFFIFKEHDYGYVIKEQFLQDNSVNKDIQKYLCKCYKYYRENRHTLFHWDNPLAEKDTSRIINTTTEAHGIIRDAILLIEEYYKISST